jgi:hypothetical protein
MPKVMQKHPKTFPWVPLGGFFEIIADLGTILFVDVFSFGKKAGQNRKKIDL